MLNRFRFSSCVVGVFVLYEFSPMVVQYTESRRWALDTSLQRRRSENVAEKRFFFLNFSPLYQVTQLLERREVLLELKRGTASDFRERKQNLSPCRSCSQVNSKFGQFTLWLCRDGKEMYNKAWCTCRVVVFCIKRIALLTFPLLSPFRKVTNTLVHGRVLLDGIRVVTNISSCRVKTTSRRESNS